MVRCNILRETRKFFWKQGFIETDTPSMVLSPGMEPHIRPFQVRHTGAYLATSPEFAMKRIVARGFHHIFQICKAYRNEPLSSTHHPEFTILEWYRGHSNYEAIMKDVENLFEHLAYALYESTKFKNQRGSFDVTPPWPRLTVDECFCEFVGVSLKELFEIENLARLCFERKWVTKQNILKAELEKPGAWDDFFFRVMLNAIEPGLAKMQKPSIVYLYPESQCALANLQTDKDGTTWAKRFEVYAGGLELGNAFDELCNPVEQRLRFEHDMKLRHALYGSTFSANPIDEEFLSALSTMPPTGGIAMGVDRIAMFFTGASDIQDVLWLPSKI